MIKHMNRCLYHTGIYNHNKGWLSIEGHDYTTEEYIAIIRNDYT